METTLVHLVVVLAALLCMVSFGRVGQMRVKHKIQAPATTGHRDFEIAYRIQMNTLEQTVPFLIVLLIAAQYANNLLVAGLGFVWLTGRVIYMITYTRNPDSRAVGFVVSFLAFVALMLTALVMTVRAFFM